MPRLLSPARLLAFAAVLALPACHWRAHHAIRVVVIGAPDSVFAAGVRLPPAGRLLRGVTAEGLVALDAEGRVVPAIADRWIVTNDGGSYIFRMRDGIWPGGAPITGDSARAALRAAIADLRGTPLARDLAPVADIRAMAGRVIEVRLAAPMPDLLQLLAQPELALTHRGKTTGPMTAKRDGLAAQLTPVAPEKRGLPAIEGWSALAQPVRLSAGAGAAALTAYAAGDADVVLGGTFVDWPRNSRTALGRYRPRLDPVIGLFGLAVARTDGLLATPDTREGVAMAIDRDAIAATLPGSGFAATTRVVAPGTDGDPGFTGERWADMALTDRQAEGARRIAAWVAANHRPAELRVALPAGPGADLLAGRLIADLTAIGVRLIRVGEGTPADLRLVDTVARYPRAAWFLDQLACAPDHRPCAPDADALAARARAAGDPANAATAPALYAQAEQALAASNLFIPLGSPVRWSLAPASRAGFAVNRWGIHNLAPLALSPQ